MLDKFTPQGFTLKTNPSYWNKSASTSPRSPTPPTPATSTSPARSRAARSTWRGNNIANVQATTWPRARTTTPGFSRAPYLTANNLVRLPSTSTKPPLNDPGVRQAISSGSTGSSSPREGETGYEMPETSTSGLLLPAAAAT